MSNLSTGSWPTQTLIRIVRGKVNGNPVRDALAACDPIYPNAYTVATGEESGELIVRGEAEDRIDEWVALVPVPAAALADLQDAFDGVDEHSPGMGVDGHRIDAVRNVLAALPGA